MVSVCSEGTYFLIRSIKVEKERRCGGIIMRRLRRVFRTLFKKVADMLEETSPQAIPVEEESIVIDKSPPPKTKEGVRGAMEQRTDLRVI